MPRHVNLSAVILLAATPLTAQTTPAAPSAPQILSALLAQAPTAQVTAHDGIPMADGTGLGLLTLMLYELGVYAPESTEDYSLSATCDPAPEPGDWACNVMMTIDWEDGESAHILSFALTADPKHGCAPVVVQTFGTYDFCTWTIRDGQIVYLLAG